MGVWLLGTLWAAQAAAQFYKCIDDSGKVTFSDQGCTSSESSSALAIQPANSMDSSRYQQPALQQYPSQAPMEPPVGRTRVTVVGGSNDAARQRQKLCREASTPHKGAHGLTAAQRAHAAELCAGISLPVPPPHVTAAPTSPSAPPAPPAVLTSCDPGGCWDSNGLRYNQGAGTTYIPANGGHACQRINGNMMCP